LFRQENQSAESMKLDQHLVLKKITGMIRKKWYAFGWCNTFELKGFRGSWFKGSRVAGLEVGA